MPIRDPWGVGEHRWSCSHEETVHCGEMHQPHGSHRLPLRPLASHRAVIPAVCKPRFHTCCKHLSILQSSSVSGAQISPIRPASSPHTTSPPPSLQVSTIPQSTLSPPRWCCWLGHYNRYLSITEAGATLVFLFPHSCPAIA